jgi:hypothetical protein
MKVSFYNYTSWAFNFGTTVMMLNGRDEWKTKKTAMRNKMGMMKEWSGWTGGRSNGDINSINDLFGPCRRPLTLLETNNWPSLSGR